MAALTVINLYTEKKFSVPPIKLFKDEKLHLKLDISDVDALDYVDIELQGKDLVFNVYSDAENHSAATYMGQAVVKNYTSKDVITNNGSFGIYNSDDVLLLDLRNDYRIQQIIPENYASKSVVGSFANTDINAEAYTMYSKGVKINDTTKKGLTITLGNSTIPVGPEEFNNTVVGSKYSDTIKGGTGNDFITAGTGNDIITGGKGNNVVIYNKNDGNDVINLTKGENFVLGMNDLHINDLTFDFVKSDLVISYLDDYGLIEKITLKGFATKDVTNNSSKTTPDTSSVILAIAGEYIDLREKLYDVNIVKNYTGNWHNENIDASGYINLLNNKGLTINAGAGDDKIVGSLYNDTITGGKGSDTFVFSIGHGVDTLKDACAEDTIEFLGIEKNNLILLKNGNNLEIKNKLDDGDKVVITNFYKSKNPVDNVKIGETIYHISTDFDDINISGKGSITGTEGADTIIGSDSKDTIKGLGGNDTITAGKGNDILYGGTGNNTFIFSQGDGEDTIKDAKLGDVIKLKNIKNSDLFFAKFGNNLVIKNDKESKDSITIENYYVASSKINTIIDSEDQPLSIQDHLEDIIITGKGRINGTNGDDQIIGSPSKDTIYGLEGDDYIDSGCGNDIIYGGTGANVYAFSKGDGNDTVVGTNSYADYYDTLYFLDSTFDELKNYKMDGNDLVISYNNKKDSVRVKDYFKANNTVRMISDSTEDVRSLLEVFPSVISSNASIINGTEISDDIWSSDKDTTVYGNGGSDSIITGHGDDIIYTYKKDKKNLDPFSNVYVAASTGNNAMYAQSATSRLHGSTGNDTYNSYIKDQKTLVVERVFSSTSTGTNTLTILDAKHDDINIIFNISRTTGIKNLFDETERTYDYTGGVGFVDKANFELWKEDPTNTNIQGTFINFNTNGLKYDSTSTSVVKSSVTDVYSSDGYRMTTSELAGLMVGVLCWLEDYKDVYDNTTEALQNASAGEIQALVGRYATASWEKVEPVG